MKKIKTHMFHRGATQTGIVLVATVLASCGGGGGSGGGSSSGSDVPTLSFAQESNFSGAIGPINATAAYDRGYTGRGAVVHMIDAYVVADDSKLKTHVTRQYEVSETASGDPTVVLDNKVPYTSAGSYSDTIKAQLIAEPRNGEYGLGVSYDAEIFAYGLNRNIAGEELADSSRLRASAIEATRSNNAGVVHLDFALPTTGADGLPEVIVDAMENVAQDGRHLMTISANTEFEPIGGQPSPIPSWDFENLARSEESLIVIGGPTSRNAGAAKDSFLYVPDPGYEVQMWDYQATRTVWCGGTLFSPVFCTEIIPEEDRYSWKTISVTGDSELNGSSYGQAVASGAAAVLQSAYPYLSAAEIKSLMLTTAEDLGEPGVDEVWGHGALDLDRATQPVGELAIAEGQSVDGPSASVSSTHLALGPAFGDAMMDNGLLAQGVAFDDFGRPYTVGLDRRVDHHDDGLGLRGYISRPDMEQGSTRFGDMATLHMAAERRDPGQAWTTSLSELQRQETNDRYTMALDVEGSGFGKLRLGIGTSPQSVLGLNNGDLALASDDLGFISSRSMGLPQLDLVGGGAGVSLTHAFDPSTDLIFGLHSNTQGVDLVDGERHAVQALARHRLTDRLTVGIGVGMLDEQGTFLASDSSGAFGENAENQAAFGSVLGRYARGDWSLEGSWTVAAARPSLGADSMLGDLGTVYADSWSVGLIKRDVLDDGDRLGLMLGQPFRVTSAKGTLDVPVSRDFSGNVIRSSEQVSLTPSGREIDIELAYARDLTDATSLDTHLFLRNEPGHDASAAIDTGVVTRLSWHW